MFSDSFVIVLFSRIVVVLDIVAQIANTTGIPHIEFDWKLEATRQEHLNNQMTVNVAPSLSALSRAYFEIIKTNYEWRIFTLIYETPEGEFATVIKLLSCDLSYYICKYKEPLPLFLVYIHILSRLGPFAGSNECTRTEQRLSKVAKFS